MSVSKELMELLTAALGSEGGFKAKGKAPGRPKKAPAAPEVSNINGIDIVEMDAVPKAASVPKAPKAAPKPKKVAIVEDEPVAAAPAPKAKRAPVKAMPHSCTCPLCPLKD